MSVSTLAYRFMVDMSSGREHWVVWGLQRLFHTCDPLTLASLAHASSMDILPHLDHTHLGGPVSFWRAGRSLLASALLQKLSQS